MATDMVSIRGERRNQRGTPGRSRAVPAAIVALTVAALVILAAPAFAGQSSTGELAFYPCGECHPVVLGADGKPTTPLPNDFEQHDIILEVHDTLGTDDRACLACHDDPARDPGMLVLPDGSLEPVTGDVSRVCQRCHFEKYREWEVGIHGKHEAKCTSSGCHDPHTPSWIYIPALPPFQGTGIEVRAVSQREAFTPLAGPPVPAGVITPIWLSLAAALGALTAVGLIGFLVLGRTKR